MAMVVHMTMAVAIAMVGTVRCMRERERER